MKLSQRTIHQLTLFVTGDNDKAPYRSGPMLVRIFNDLGYSDNYGPGFPSRRQFAEERIRGLNKTTKIKLLIENTFDPLDFNEANEQLYKEHGYTLTAHDKELDVSMSIADFNDYLNRDGFEVSIVDGRAKVKNVDGSSVDFALTPSVHNKASEDFITEQLQKCESKLKAGDYRGAITNARSLCEEVLLDLERQLNDQPSNYNGNLPQLHKRVGKKLRMDQANFQEHDSVVQLLRGLTSIVDGISGISNAMSDRHGGGEKAKPHHAVLCVNSAKTLCSFMVSSFASQFKQS